MQLFCERNHVMYRSAVTSIWAVLAKFCQYSKALLCKPKTCRSNWTLHQCYVTWAAHVLQYRVMV